MPRLTVTLSDERTERVENLVDGEEIKSKSGAVNKLIDDGERAHQLEQEVDELRNRLEESRQREIARDKTKQELEVFRKELREDRRASDAPFPVRWVRWLRSRGD